MDCVSKGLKGFEVRKIIPDPKQNRYSQRDIAFLVTYNGKHDKPVDVELSLIGKDGKFSGLKFEGIGTLGYADLDRLHEEQNSFYDNFRQAFMNHFDG